MKEKFNLVVSNLKRVLSNSDLSYKIYMVFAILTFILIGVFGIVPSSKVFIANIKLAIDMNKSNSMLSSKLVELKKVEGDLKAVEDSIFFLENYLPEQFNVQDYIVDFVFSSGETDFSIDRVTPVKEAGDVINLAIVFVGNGSPVELVNILESLNRVTEIQDLKVSQNEGYTTLSMLVKTFIMEKQ